MSISWYEHMKSKWAGITPIRGRAGDVRPIDKRRRDWERILAKPQPDGTTSYACRLHNTDCVEFFPNGDVVVRTEGWNSTVTAAFISRFSPFTACKAHNHLWVGVNVSTADGSRMYKYIPVPGLNEYKHKGITFKAGEGGYTVEAPPMYRKEVKRTLAKKERERFMPFLSWAKTFLTLSDGWIMYETRASVLPKWENPMDWEDPLKYESIWSHRTHTWTPSMLEWATQEDNYLLLLCNLMARWNALAVRNVGDDSQDNFRFKQDMKFEYAAVKRLVYKMVEKSMPVHAMVQIPPSTRPLRDIEPL